MFFSTAPQVINWGFEGIWPPPPRNRWELRGGGIGHRAMIPVFGPWYNTGYEVQSVQPPHPRPERASGLFARGDDGAENPMAVLVPFSSWGFDQTATQPPRWKWELRGAGLKHRSEFAFFPTPFPEGWQVQPVQPPHPRPERAGSLMRGDDGAENVFQFRPPDFINMGSDGVYPQPPHRRVEKFAGLVGGDPGMQAIFVRWQNIGWEIAPHQPRHPRVEKFATMVGGDPGIEGTYTAWINGGWPVQPVQPGHPRPERSGSIARGEDGIENIYFPTAPQIINLGFDGVWPQPPHQRPERAGAIAKGDEGTQGTYQVWRNGGWEPTPVHPPHPRPERSGAIARWEDGTEAVYSFIPPGFVSWGYEPPITYMHVRYARAAATMRGDDGIEGTYSRWINDGFEQVDSQARVLRLERDKAALMRGDDGTAIPLIFWRNSGWEIQPPQPPHPLREKSGSLMKGDEGIEAAFVFVPFLQVSWWAQTDITYSRAGIYHPAGAIMPWEQEGWYQKVLVPVFYACSVITTWTAQTSVSTESAQSVVTQASGQTTVKGEPQGGPCQ
jgi:hypothetical protein